MVVVVSGGAPKHFHLRDHFGSFVWPEHRQNKLTANYTTISATLAKFQARNKFPLARNTFVLAVMLELILETNRQAHKLAYT